jgi:hypothetical protein
MKKLNVYFLETCYPYLTWHDVFLELVIYLKNNYEVNLIHQKCNFLQLPNYDYALSDCEILIEDVENDVLRGITFSESRTGFFDNVFAKRNNKNDILMLTQYYGWFPRYFKAEEHYNFKILPTTYYTFRPTINHNYWYRQRQFMSYDNLFDQMFCLSSTGRGDLPRLRDKGVMGPLVQGSDYFDHAIRYKVGFSVTGVPEICCREIEYMAIGLPNFRLEYMTQLNPPLIPNYHYIAVDRSNFPWDANKDREGGDEYVQAYIERFNEVKDDKEFLTFISTNARKYYLENCSDENRLKHIVSSLGL